MKRLFSTLKNMFFKQRNVKISGRGNVIDVNKFRHVKIKINGNDNTVCIKKFKGNININIYGSNNKVVIDDFFGKLQIDVSTDNWCHAAVHNVSVILGKRISAGSCFIYADASNSTVELLDDCMLSQNVTIKNSDGHLIKDAKTGEIINRPEFVKIGKHVWLGANVTVLKNTVIPDDCIVGWGSIVSGMNKTAEGGVSLQVFLQRLLKEMLFGILMPQMITGRRF